MSLNVIGQSESCFDHFLICICFKTVSGCNEQEKSHGRTFFLVCFFEANQVFESDMGIPFAFLKSSSGGFVSSAFLFVFSS